MTVSKARHLVLAVFCVAACAKGAGGDGFGTTEQPLTVAPITCPTAAQGAVCSWPSPPAGSTANSATFVAVGGNPSEPAGERIAADMIQTFFIPAGTIPGSGSQAPGTFYFTAKRLLAPSSTPGGTNEDVYFDLYDLGTNWGVSPDNVPPIPVVSGVPACPTTTLTNVGPVNATLIAEARLNSLNLVYDVDTQVAINFLSKGAGGNMVNGHWYGVWIYIPSPGTMHLGIASNSDSAAVPTGGSSSVKWALYTRQEFFVSGSCLTNPLWVEDAVRILNFGFTVGTGCTTGQVETCGTGACQRTISACDSYGNTISCYPAGQNPDGGPQEPGLCTTNADCIGNWNAVYYPDGGAAKPIDAGVGENESCYNQLGSYMTGVCVPNLPDGGPNPCIASFNCTPSQIFSWPGEVCNGIDDNCNGTVDDPSLMPVVSCGLGVCASVSTCNSGVLSACVPNTGNKTTEICNGFDDDCNGTTDDLYPADPMGIQPVGPCGFGICRTTSVGCFNPGDGGTPYVPSCVPAFGGVGTAEVCDGLDNDCDGFTDNVARGDGGFLSRFYYPPGEPGLQPSTWDGGCAGACCAGLQECNTLDGGWSYLSPGYPPVLPTPEIDAGNGPVPWPGSGQYLCNGLDDDCNGTTDDNPGTGTYLTRPYWPETDPRANGLYTGYSAAWLADAGYATDGGGWLIRGRCAAGVETCNSNGHLGATSTVAQTQNLNVGTAYAGPEANHVNWFVNGLPILPTGETCNGIDDDCNGLTDDGFNNHVCGTGVCQTNTSDCVFFDGGWSIVGDAGYCYTGQTAFGTTVAGNWGLASSEACDGLDNDCDGMTDNVLGAGFFVGITEGCFPLCNNYNSWAGRSGNCTYGGTSQFPVRQGNCSPGTLACGLHTPPWDGGANGYGFDPQCGSGGSAEVGPTNEICNGLDDDCNGVIDNINAGAMPAINNLCGPTANVTASGSLCPPASLINSGGVPNKSFIDGGYSTDAGYFPVSIVTDCAITQCNPGYWDLDQNYTNGCEFNEFAGTTNGDAGSTALTWPGASCPIGAQFHQLNGGSPIALGGTTSATGYLPYWMLHDYYQVTFTSTAPTSGLSFQNQGTPYVTVTGSGLPAGSNVYFKMYTSGLIPCSGGYGGIPDGGPSVQCSAPADGGITSFTFSDVCAGTYPCNEPPPGATSTANPPVTTTRIVPFPQTAYIEVWRTAGTIGGNPEMPPDAGATEYVNGPVGSASASYTLTLSQISCAAGTYNSGTSCSAVAAGCYGGAGATTSCPTQCAAGTYATGGATSCSVCAAGTYSAVGSSSCTACAAGTYSSAGSGNCAPVSAGCYGTTTGATSACPLTCAAGSYSQGGATSCTPDQAGCYGTSGGATNPCPIQCLAGTYSGAGATSCTTCPMGTASGAGAASCGACPAGTYSTAGSGVCTPVSAGCYGAAGATTACPSTCGAGTYSTGGATSCTNITAGCYGPAGSTQACPNSCTAGSYSTGGASACTPETAGCYGSTGATTACQNTCAAGSYSLTGSSSCSAVTAGCYGSSPGATSACPNTCGAGTYSNSGATGCINDNPGCFGGAAETVACPNTCARGSYSTGGASSCTPVSAGCYDPSTGGQTTACPSTCLAGTYSTAGASSCTNINAGCWGGAGATSACPNSCPAGQYSAAGASVCQTCGAGTFSLAGSSTCTSDNAGCYGGVGGTTACPTQCAAGSWSSAGSTSCSSISAGCWGAAGATSTCPNTCAAGTYSTGGASVCTNVSPGCYGSAGAINACPVTCGAGTYATGGASVCSNVSAGCYGPAGAGTACPNQCAAGSYSPGGLAACTTCAAGTYSSTTGAAECSPDSAGCYGSATGSTVACPTTCPTGTYSSGGASACASDVAGCYGGPGGTTQCPNPCPAGQYSTGGATTCSTCVAGTYAVADSSSCTSCPAGTWSAADSGSCTNCMAGTSSPANSTSSGACTSCAAGTYTTGSGGACLNDTAGCYGGAGATSACPTTCSAGSWSAAGSSSCTNCAANYSSPAGSTVSTACTACPAGQSDPVNPSTCANCSAGYTSTAGSACTACPCGTYATSAGSASCTACAVNTMAAGTGNTTCVAAATCTSAANVCGATQSNYYNACDTSCTTPGVPTNTCSFSFTTCTATGSAGPTQAQCNTAYPSGNTLYNNVTVSTTSPTIGMQSWTVPGSGTNNWVVKVQGAQGGALVTSGSDGYGALEQGTFALASGTILRMLVGQAGTTTASEASGGGASVVYSSATSGPIVIAGGGGGMASTASATSEGQASATACSTTGLGGADTANHGAGGGGYSGNGTADSTALGGVAYTGGGTGGTGGAIAGGFGGGGDVRVATSSGGGGGWVGGSAAAVATGAYANGGTSCISTTTSVTDTSGGAASGAGSITLTPSGAF